MTWKLIGKSVIGTSHVQSGKDCEDSNHFEILNNGQENEIAIGFVSDGAGSAKFAKQAAIRAVQEAVSISIQYIEDEVEIEEKHLVALVERIYDIFRIESAAINVPLNEFSCTLLGFITLPHKSCFLQIGDGAIVRNDGSGHFTYIWWPQNGEYQNTTSFIVDDANVRNLQVKIIHEKIDEIGMFTDGLQMLALDYDSECAHQPFFNDLFKWLRRAESAEHVSILNRKLDEYLSSTSINNRTDDDKTLLLATKYIL